MADGNRLSALVVTPEAIRRDPAWAEGGRHARKLLSITPPFPSECIAQDMGWEPGTDGTKTPIVLTEDFECAIFESGAKEDRHVHKLATEVYYVIEGILTLEINDERREYRPGTLVFVFPGTVHEVICQGYYRVVLFCSHCGGPADKQVM
ncbi:MAG: cupin domain-containing protein [bacterium]